MDNSPKGTPNPLNPNPASNSTTTTVPVASLDPTGRTMEKTIETPEPPKKSKTGLIASIIIGCVLLIGGIVTAVLVAMNSHPDDAVDMAIKKIINGEASKNVTIKGKVDLSINDKLSLIRHIAIDLDSNLIPSSMINSSSAVITLTDRNGNDFTTRLEEMYASDNNLFFKIDGLMAALEDSGLLGSITGSKTDCLVDENNATNCKESQADKDCTDEGDCAENDDDNTVANELNSLLISTITDVIEAADGLYLRISAEDVNSMSTGMTDSANITCMTDVISELNRSSNSTALLYDKYPFIGSSNENIPVASNQNPIYQIVIDGANLTNFIGEIQNTKLADSLYDCFGWSNQASVTESDVEKIVNGIPKIYTEVDGDYNFTRLYVESDANNMASIKVDLGFSYPSSITVSEPAEYTNFEDLVEKIVEKSTQEK